MISTPELKQKIHQEIKEYWKKRGSRTLDVAIQAADVWSAALLWKLGEYLLPLFAHSLPQCILPINIEHFEGKRERLNRDFRTGFVF